MRLTIKMIVSLALFALPICGAGISFQNGVGGYFGTQDVVISSQNGGNGITLREEQNLCVNSPVAGYTARILLRFDDLAIPAGQRVASATLTLNFETTSSNFTLSGYYLKSAWQSADPGLGWLSRSATESWSAPGAFGTSDLVNARFFLVSGFHGTGDETLKIALDPTVVNGWISNPASNQGVMLTNNVVERVLRMASGRHSNILKRPVLTLVTESAQTPSPTDLMAAAPADGQINLSWALASGFSANAVLVERKTASGTYAQIAQTAGNSKSYADKNLLVGSTYTYRVRASYNAGLSSYSSEVTTSSTAPSAASTAAIGTLTVGFQNGQNGYTGTRDLAISSQGGNNGVVSRASQALCTLQPNYDMHVLLRFDQLSLPPGSTLTEASLSLTFDEWTPNITLTGYYLSNSWDPAATKLGWLYRDNTHTWGYPGASGGKDILPDKTFLVSGFKGTGTQTLIISLDPEIVAQWIQNPASNQGILLVSNVVGVAARLYTSRDTTATRRPSLVLSTAQPVAPPPPFLSATAVSPTEIDLAWPTGTDASLTGYSIERRTGAAGYSTLIALPSSASSHKDSTVSASTSYVYRISASGAGGTSPYSNEVSVTTPAPAVVAPPPTTPTPVASSGAHPRIWLDATTLERLQAARAANSTDWTAFKSKADLYASYSVPPFDRTACPAQSICYTYQGGGYHAAMTHLALAYKLTGDMKYGSKLKQILSAMVATWKAGNQLPISADSGYSSRFLVTALALGYDWGYDLLSSSDKSDICSTLNYWYDWYSAKGYQKDGPVYGNYFGGHILGFGLGAIATKDDNPRSGEIAAAIRARFDSQVMPAFTSGGFQGGYPIESFNYGPNHFIRLFQYMLALKTAGGDNLFAGNDVVARCARNLIYNIKPGGWRVSDEGDFPGVYVGTLDKTYPQFLGYLLGSTEEGRWMQFVSAKLAKASKLPANYDPTPFDKLLFSDISTTASDYSSALAPSLFSKGDAHTYSRTDWSDGAVWSSFNAGTAYFVDHQSKAAGHIAVQRGNDYLLINAGQWAGTTGLSGTPQVADKIGWRANTLFFDDFGEYLYTTAAYVGGQGYWGATKVLAHEEKPTYVYSRADLGSAYERPVPVRQDAIRSLRFYERSYLNVGGATIFVFDRLQALKAAYTKTLFWHVSPQAVNTINKNLVQSNLGSSTLWLKTLLPTTPTVTLASDTTTWGGTTPYAKRFEVSDARTSTDNTFLTVLMPRRLGDSAPSAELIDAGTMTGAWQLDGTTARVALFSTDGTPQTKVLYSAPVPSSASVTHVLVDMADRAYSVKLNGKLILPRITSTSAGVVTFTFLGGGTFEVEAEP